MLSNLNTFLSDYYYFNNIIFVFGEENARVMLASCGFSEN
jgi:hypothetical protein